MQDAPPPPIIVTAPSLPAPAAEQALMVEEMDAGELRNAPSTQLDEVLKSVAGLQLFRRSDARSSHPTSQGVTLRALGGNASSRALLVLDGVPQSDPFGGWINWPAYDPAALASVRVVRGGGTVARGAGALAGTIEMQSVIAEKLDASLEVGSREAVEGRFLTGLGGGLSLSGRAARGEGFVPVTRATRGLADRRAPYEQVSVRAQLARSLGAETDIQLSGSVFRDARQRGVAYTANRTHGADAALRLVRTGSLPWSVLGYAQWRELRSSFASVSADRTQASRVSLQDAVPASGFGGAVELRPQLASGELRIGADARLTSGESREVYSYVAGLPTRRRIAGGETLNGGAFAELTSSLGDFALSGGVRLDHWRIGDGKLFERQLASQVVLRDERYGRRSGWLPTGRLGAVHTLSEAFNLRSAAYLGWRLPTLNELFRPFRAGQDATAANPLLKPERLRGIEAGFSFNRSGVSLDATAFSNRLTGAIANVTLATGPGLFPGVGFVGAGGEYRQRKNLDAVFVRGVEVRAEAQRGHWTGRIGYSFAAASTKAEGPATALNGLRPAQTPRHIATAALAWANSGRSFSLQLRRVGDQFEDDLNARKLPAVTTVDVFATLPLSQTLSFVARAENLLDRQVVAGVSGDGAVERATPRTIWFGLHLPGTRTPR